MLYKMSILLSPLWMLKGFTVPLLRFRGTEQSKSSLHTTSHILKYVLLSPPYLSLLCSELYFRLAFQPTTPSHNKATLILSPPNFQLPENSLLPGSFLNILVSPLYTSPVAPLLAAGIYVYQCFILLLPKKAL